MFTWATDVGGGILDSIVAGPNIVVNSTISAANPIVSLNSTIAVSSMSVSTISTSTIISNAPDGVILLKPTGTGTINIAGPLDMQNNVIFDINGLTGASGNIDFTDSLTLRINGNIPNNDVLFNRINNVIIPSTIIASTINTSTISSLTIRDTTGSPGTLGQLLVSGGNNVKWSTISGGGGTILPNGTKYSDYLFWNSTTSAWSVGSSTIHIGSFAGQAGQSDGGIVIGSQIFIPGINGIQSTNAIALGTQAGFSNNPVAQADGAIAIGYYAGSDNSGGYQESNSIAIGTNAGIYGQSTFSIAIGYNAGGGWGGGGTNPQGINSIAIGNNAGRGASLGTNSIAIGYLSGVGAQGIESTIVINASGQPLTPSPISGGGLFIQPIRYGASGAPFSTLQYSPFSGEVTYTGKTFVIDHPKNPERYLVHACLEGPEDGIYYRGKGEITSHSNSTIITLPNYVDALGTDFTVQITPIFNGAVLTYAASEITNGSFTVHGQPGRFFWLVHGKRSTFNIEPLKTSAHLVGNGPYKWLEYTKSV
jgi:hypothetical protein